MLHAFVHADAVSSTELLATHGVAATVSARLLVDGIIDREARRFGGTVLTSRGDGTLLRFSSAVAAVRAAAAVQLAVRAEQDQSGHTVELRMGVGVVDVDDDHDGAEQAMRVEQLGTPGRVTVDPLTHRVIATHLSELTSNPAGMAARADVFEFVVDDMVLDDAAAPSRVNAIVFTEPEEGVDASALAGFDAVSILVHHGGKILDTNGLGHVAAFEACGNAVDAARALHVAAADAALRRGGGVQVRYRVGVAVGEVTRVGDAQLGRAIVEAARLQSFADAGTTCATDDVCALARVGDEFAAEGLVALKGLADPIGVQRTDADVAPPALLELPQRLAGDARFALVDRGQESQQLQRAWSDVNGGEIRSVAVSGAEGVGKTRLVREFVNEAHAHGATVLFGACLEDSTMPFAPIAQALQRAAPLDEELSAASAGEGALAPLLGQVAGAGTADRVDIVTALVGVLGRLADRRPVVLVIDDLQWAAPDATELLTQLLLAAPDIRLLLLVTCRDTDVDRGHATHRFLTAARDRRAVERCPLAPLSPDGVATMLASRIGSELSAEEVAFAHHLERISGGNPLYVEELITHLVANHSLIQRDDRWSLNVAVDDLSVPESVVELMSQRIGRLGSDARDVLTVAAVMGSSFDLMVLANVLGRPLLDVVDIVEVAEQARLVSEDDTGGTCSFSDELVRAALLDPIRPTRRALVHQQIAEALEQIAPERVDELALHWRAAVGSIASEKAIQYLQLAGERDMAAAAWESSVERHRQVLELLGRSTDARSDAVIEATAAASLALGLSMRAIGADGFRPHLLEAGRLAKRVERADLVARAAIAMMRPGAWYPEAAVVDREISMMCEDALLMASLDDSLRVRVLAALATNLAYEPDEARRNALIAEAQTLAHEIGDSQLLGTALAAELMTSRRPNQFERRAELADEVARIGRVTGDHDLAITGGIFLVLEAIERGDLRRARKLRQDLADVVEIRRTYWPRFLVEHLDASLLTVACDDASDQQIAKVFEEFAQQPVDALGVWTIQVAARGMQAGNLAELLLPLTQMTEDDDDEEWSRKWTYAVAKAHLDTGDPEAALEAVLSNLEPDFDNYWLVSVHNLGALGLALDRTDLCERAIEWMTPYRGRLGVVGIGACIGGQVSTALGQAYLGLGDIERAVELLREAVLQAHDMATPYFECVARRYLAMALLQQGDTDEAAQLMSDVLTAANEFGFAHELHEVEKLLGRAPAHR